MHRLLTGNDITDHADGDKLNNKRSNLRSCTYSQNGMNRGKSINNTSGYKGVIYRKDRGKWSAKIYVSGTAYYLGCYSDKEDAAKAYDVAATRMCGEFAKTNL